MVYFAYDLLIINLLLWFVNISDVFLLDFVRFWPDLKRIHGFDQCCWGWIWSKKSWHFLSACCAHLWTFVIIFSLLFFFCDAGDWIQGLAHVCARHWATSQFFNLFNNLMGGYQILLWFHFPFEETRARWLICRNHRAPWIWTQTF